MKRFISIFFVFMISGVFTLYAQGELEALRFSQSGIVGTARSLGLAGGSSAMGADLSAATLNPAGLALYRRGEMVFTPSIRLVNTQTDYLGSASQATRSKFGFSNMGVAVHTPMFQGYGEKRRQAQSGLLSYVVAFGFNQLENYARETYASGYNLSSSFTDFLAERANGTIYSNLDALSYGGMGFDTYAIDFLEGPNGILEDQYFGAGTGGELQQTIRIAEKGRRNEWFFSMAANVDDFFYFGGTLGIQTFRYDQEYRYTEEDINNMHNYYVFNPNNTSGFPLEFPFNKLELRENLRIEGNGVNLKLGLMVRPIDQLRIGISFHSPTMVGFTDNYSVELAHEHNLDLSTYTVRDQDTVMAVTHQDLTSGYNLVTPYRLNMGLMYVLGKKGFFTADVEYVNYKSARLRSSLEPTNAAYYDYQAENNTIKELFASAINTRLGFEVRQDIYRVRLGAAFYGTPLEEAAHVYEDYDNPGTALTLKPNRRLFTLGIGVRQPNYFLDVAYINQLTKEKLNPYTTTNTALVDPTIISKVRSSSVAVTLGFKL